MLYSQRYPRKESFDLDFDPYINTIYIALDDKKDLIEVRLFTFLDFLSLIGGFLSSMYGIGSFFASLFS